MKMCFVSPTAIPKDATSSHAGLPRTMRKTLRLPTTRTKPCTQAGVDHYIRTEMRVDSYFNQNLEYLDRGYDFDEFNDVDDEYEGLTIVDAMTEAELIQFCTGYDIL